MPANQLTGHQYYTPSPTAAQIGNFSRNYGSGPVAGKVFQDRVVIAGITATSAVVGAATSAASYFVNNTQENGLLGISCTLDYTSPTPQSNWFTTIKSQLTAPLFTVDLFHNAPGSYDFGFIDSTKYTGSITYASRLTADCSWTINVGVYYSGTTGFAGATVGSALIDTGTSIIKVPQSVAANY